MVVLSGLTISALLTSCANSPSFTLEEQVKLNEYQKCLLLQQENLNTINERLGRERSELSLIEILEGQSKPKGDTNQISRFEIHLKNCAMYRP